MKARRFQFAYRKSASKLHKGVGDLLRSSELFRYHGIYQEYPVVRVNPAYSETSHHFDWVVHGLKIVIECHGKQHYEVVAFDGDVERAISEFPALQARDRAKREAALQAGWTYVEIPYKLEKKLNLPMLLQLIEVGNRQLEEYTREKGISKPKRAQREKSEYHQQQLERARQYRKEQYRRKKRWAKELKDE